MTEAPRFPWTRIKTGLWSAYSLGYQIIGKPGHWRIIRHDVFWDLAPSLTQAKRLCERDKARRDAELQSKP